MRYHVIFKIIHNGVKIEKCIKFWESLICKSRVVSQESIRGTELFFRSQFKYKTQRVRPRIIR